MSEPGQTRFVVQEHHARTHHYDFRLERDGVFKSWVLRKSIPAASGIRRLAIHVEDHNLSFGDFEGEIPRGKYGAGKITIWDTGTCSVSSWDRDHISFRLHGSKLVGDYSLIRFKRAGPDRWLLVKRNG